MLEGFRNVSILIVGDVMLDRYWWGDVTRISPEAPVPVVRLHGERFAPGGAANVAANVAGLGAKPVILGAVGADPEAAVLAESLSELGIDASNLFELPGQSTIVKTRIIAHSQQVVRVDREERLFLTPEQETAISERSERLIADADVVLVSDYGKGFLSDEFLAFLIAKAAELQKPLLIDPKGKDYGKYTGATLLTPNKLEAADACGLDIDSPDLITAAGRKLIEEVGVENVLITQGSNGMTLFQTGREPLHISSAEVETYDVTGAGDTVISTIAVALGCGLDLAESARIANLAAGRVVQHVGTTTITIDHLREALSESGSGRASGI